MAGDAWGGTWGSAWATSWTRSDYVPVDDTAFNEWLEGEHERCWLAEFSAVGYDAIGSPVATKTINFYISNMAFVSHSTDTPSSQAYSPCIEKIPTFSSEIGMLLSGKVSTGIGRLLIKSPAEAGNGPGVRDDWTRIKFRRDYITLYMGDRNWRKADFRKFVVGVVDQPAASGGLIELPIADILDRLNRPLQTNRYDTGPMQGKLKPVMQGHVLWMEPVPTSAATLELQLNDGPVAEIGNGVFDNGVTMTGSGTIASVDSGTETITTVDPHGLSADARVVFMEAPADPPPAPLVANTTYYVISAGLGGSTFRLAATRGGSAINLTNTDAGGIFTSYSWWEDLSNGKITLTSQPVGRVMVKGARTESSIDDCDAANVISALLFDRFGLSNAYKDQDSFDELETDVPDFFGVAFYDQNMPTALGALDQLCRGSNAWYGASPDGEIRVGRLELPESTSVMDFIVSEVRGLRLKNRLLPVNISTMAVRYSRQFYLNGPLNLAPGPVTESELLRPYATAAGSGVLAPAPGTMPLDDHPEVADTFDMDPMESLFSSSGSAEITRLGTLYGKMLGVFVFETTIKACRLKLGQTIQLEHPRLGWKVYDSGDPQSPDNLATFDATKAVVIGIDVNPAAEDAFKVKLTVFRQVPGYYPTSDLN